MSYNCITLPVHGAGTCVYQKGGISAVAVLLEGYDSYLTDFENPTEWNAAIAAGTVKLITDIKGEIPAPNEVNGENPLACGPDQILDGLTYESKLKDFQVSEQNIEFYAKLNQIPAVGFVWYMCNSDVIDVIINQVRFASKLVTPMSNKEKRYFDVKVTAYVTVDNNGGLPTEYTAPSGIFS